MDEDRRRVSEAVDAVEDAAMAGDMVMSPRKPAMPRIRPARADQRTSIGVRYGPMRVATSVVVAMPPISPSQVFLGLTFGVTL
jgi:hypothetical protein